MQPDVQALCHLRQSPSALRQSGNSTETRQQVIAAGELRTGQDGGVGAAPSQRWGGRSSNWGHSNAASRRGGAPTYSSQNWAGLGATTNSHQISQVWELPLNQAERLNGGVGAAPSQRWGGRSSSNGCSAVAGKKVAARSWQRWPRSLSQSRHCGSGCLFSGKTLAIHAVGAQHLNGWQRAGLEAHEAARVRQGGVPADREMAALEAIGSAIGRRLFFGHGNPSGSQVGTASSRDYCSSLSTVCVC
jgi:hypothetical protein